MLSQKGRLSTRMGSAVENHVLKVFPENKKDMTDHGVRCKHRFCKHAERFKVVKTGIRLCRKRYMF